MLNDLLGNIGDTIGQIFNDPIVQTGLKAIGIYIVLL